MFYRSRAFCFVATFCLMICATGHAVAQPLVEPINLPEALRRATEESQQFLTDLPAWLSSPFANAHPVWRREMLLRKVRAGASVSDQAVVLQGIEELELLATQQHMPVALAYALLRRTRIESGSGNFHKAMTFMTQAMSVLSRSGVQALVGMGNTEFCGLHYRMGQIEQAMAYCELAGSQLQNGVDESNLGRAKNFTSILPGEQKKDAAAIAIAQIARARFVALGMLTGVLNRRAIMEQMQSVFERRHADAGAACLCIVDADHFKLINDTYGHQAGDAALQRIAKILSTGLPQGASVGRLDGEEFAVLLTGQDAILGLAQAERFRERVADQSQQNEVVKFPIAVSIGVAPFLTTIEDCASWFARADRAVYAAKAAGRNRTILAQTDES
jgi:diguanylate cyclase (GGDEF)-like protein